MCLSCVLNTMFTNNAIFWYEVSQDCYLIINGWDLIRHHAFFQNVHVTILDINAFPPLRNNSVFKQVFPAHVSSVLEDFVFPIERSLCITSV